MGGQVIGKRPMKSGAANCAHGRVANICYIKRACMHPNF